MSQLTAAGGGSGECNGRERFALQRVMRGLAAFCCVGAIADVNRTCGPLKLHTSIKFVFVHFTYIEFSSVKQQSFVDFKSTSKS